MVCVSPFTVKVEDREVVVPCGRCRACRIQRSKEWSMRLFHESLYYDDSIFVTLTYDDEHLPSDCMIKKEHFVRFIKSLRKQCESKIKYYGCGEYGESTGRPHYHVIIFGLGVDEHSYKRFSNGKLKLDTLVAEKGPCRAAWRKGNVILGTVTKKSILYVTDYIQKRLYDDAEKEDGRVQPFSLMSKNIGKRYALEHEKEIVGRMGVMVNGVNHGLPRYYGKVLGLEEGGYVKEFGGQRTDRSKDYKEFWRRSVQKERTDEARALIYRRGDL